MLPRYPLVLAALVACSAKPSPPPVLSVACADGACALHFDGRVVGEPIWTFAEPDALLVPIEGLAESWWVRASGGDGCPSLVALACVRGGQATLTEAFGNCDEPASLVVADGVITITFAAQQDENIDRPRRVVTADAATCAVHP